MSKRWRFRGTTPEGRAEFGYDCTRGWRKRQDELHGDTCYKHVGVVFRTMSPNRGNGC